jgi:adenylate cyclase class 2
MVATPTVEQELKIPVADLEPVRQLLRATDWSRVRDSGLEINILLDTPDSTLQTTDRALRLRRHGRHLSLTFKGPAVAAGAVKEREEVEVTVGDLDTALVLLERLGYRPTMRYEKVREVWRSGPLLVHLDHTPMGDFVEVEGPGQLLEEAARGLGLDPGRAVSQPYPRLWQEHRRTHPELPRDMVFPR